MINILGVLLLVCVFCLIRVRVAMRINDEFSEWAQEGIEEAETREEMELPNKVYREYNVEQFLFLYVWMWTFDDVLLWCKKRQENNK